jgi:hypothetical protein
VGLPISWSRSAHPRGAKRAATKAYVVVPAVHTFKERGVAMREAAQMAFALKKTAGSWLIHAWTWTGPKPQKVAGPAK